MSDLPPAVADRLRFDRAAPRRLRTDKMPPAVQEELRNLWDGIAADVYDEVAGLRRTKGLSSSTVERALGRVADRLLQAQRVVIFAAVHYPLKGERSSRHIAVATVGGGSAAAAEMLAVYGSLGTRRRGGHSLGRRRRGVRELCRGVGAHAAVPRARVVRPTRTWC